VLDAGNVAAAPARGTDRSPWLERIAVEARGQVRVVPVERIDYITARGPYVTLHAGGDTHVLRERMQTLEERLDSASFFRIHRSTIVRLDRVETLLRGGPGAVLVRDPVSERRVERR
jgi:two-component system LytT family response regulator